MIGKLLLIRGIITNHDYGTFSGITSTPILYPHNPRAGQSHFRDMKTGSATSMRSKMSKQQIKFKEGECEDRDEI